MSDNNDIMPNGVSKDGKTFVKYLGDRNAKEFTVPEGVEILGKDAFKGCSSLVTIKLPSSLTSIESRAFFWCFNLTSVTISANVKTIGDCVFRGCYSLKCVNVDEKNKEFCSIDGVLFTEDGSTLVHYPAGKKRGTYKVPTQTTNIGDWAFADCPNLTTVKIPDSVKRIGNRAFSNSSIVFLDIPASVTNLDNEAFRDCDSLKMITVDKKNSLFCSIDDVLFTKRGEKLIQYPTARREKRYEIPDGVTCIGDMAFNKCSSLTSVHVPKSVTKIGDRAFYDCSFLTTIVLHSGLKSIGDGAFNGCVSLTSFEIPNSVTRISDRVFGRCSALTSITFHTRVTSIGFGSFQGCSSITSISLPARLKSIGDRAFRDCSSLESVILPNRITSIGERTFDGCQSLKAVVLPSGVTNICDRAFYGCSSLKSIVLPSNVTEIGDEILDNCPSLERIDVDSDNKRYCSIDGVLYSIDGTRLIKTPEGRELETYVISANVKEITENAFGSNPSLRRFKVDENNHCFCQIYGILFTADRETLIRYPAGLKAKRYKVPKSVRKINRWAFFGCKSLESIELPERLEYIGNDTFAGCESLASIRLPENTLSIGERAFHCCKSLQKIKIPDSVTEIGESAFRQCISLKSAVLPNNITRVEAWTFRGCSLLETICLPDSVASIGDLVFEGCSSLTSIDVSKNNPHFCSIDGVLFTKSDNKLIKYPEGKREECYTVPKQTASIGNGAFCRCSFLSSLILSVGVTVIEDDAFNDCRSLKLIVLSAGVTSFDARVFDGCSSLEAIYVMPNNKTYCHIDGVLFTRDKKTLVRFPEGKKKYAYEVPEFVTVIEEKAFYHCRYIRKIVFCDPVAKVCEDAFSHTSSLESISVREGRMNYFSRDEVLFWNDGLGSVLIKYPENKEGEIYIVPSFVTGIDHHAFENCSKLRSIVATEGVAKINDLAFESTKSLVVYAPTRSSMETYAQERDMEFHQI